MTLLLVRRSQTSLHVPAYTANGSGKTIAIVAVSNFLDSDVDAYFGHENLAPPTIVRRPVDGGSPPFDINNGGSDEISLDVQQSGGSAPGATLIVYEAPDASFTPSFIDMYTAIDEDNRADIVSTSFGLCELFFLPRYNGGEDFTPPADVPRPLPSGQRPRNHVPEFVG